MAETTKVTIDVDGSCLYNGYADASAGWGAVIRVNGAVAEARCSLCPDCDPGVHTSNRAELRGVQFALHVAHELAKTGHPFSTCGGNSNSRSRGRRGDRGDSLNDARSMVGGELAVVIRTDSEFVVNGYSGVNRRVAHQDVWGDVMNCASCIRNKMSLRVEHVRGHSGDWSNEKADELARSAAADVGPCNKFCRCITCGLEFEDDADMACHMKEMHMQRNLGIENAFEAMFSDVSDGDGFVCQVCDKVTLSRYALQQHVRDKHF